MQPLAVRLLAFTMGLLSVGASSAASAAAPQASEEAQQSTNDCIMFRRLYDWKSLDENHMVLWAPRNRDAYLLTFAIPLSGLRFEHQLAFIDRNGDGYLCGLSNDEVAVRDRTFPQRTTIKTMTKLDEDALAALEQKYNVKLALEPRKKTIPKEPERSTAE
jgi:hypothetical protein